ncbi:uncharacterized protein LOC124916470 [Impatiens glandulifera]|uniref:uncharacterized protein LOC124916470 n=1 Tax=Impatiens glandulifera TaxID=253017 RepID=UPI001FB0A05D|nr:uncharacterized protein LOC124916470 [Impatiens glandulifera]
MNSKICPRLDLVGTSTKSKDTISKLAESFRTTTSTLLSFIFPLSFLLLAKLTTARFLLTFGRIQTMSFLASLFLNQTPLVLHMLISLITIPALIHNLTGLARLTNKPTSPVRPSGAKLLGMWILLCTFQVCVGIGIEGSMATGMGVVDFDGLEGYYSLGKLCLLFFFVGLHETTRYWARMVVRPVVDDTFYGEGIKEETWVERVGVAVGFGGLWWCRMRDEVESLVFVVRWKKELLMEIGMADMFGWLLYYLTMVIGMVRVLNSLSVVGRRLFIRSRKEDIDRFGNDLEDNV